KGYEKAGDVTVIRDQYGVPHLYAKNKQDLYKAYGYVMAKDRLFQLEMFRRGNEGTVSEVFGEEYLAKDEQSRRDGYSDEEIKEMLNDLEDKPRAYIQQFAEGISLYVQEALKNPDEKLSKEFHDYKFLPRKWDATDVVRLYLVSMTYFMDNHQELTNAEILAKLEQTYGEEQAEKMFDDLVWKNDPEAPASIQAEDEAEEEKEGDKAVQPLS
nr:Chain A, Penicillin G acylase [Bacillus thermotolerans]6NVY_C Chain C, Penicillin G acylase [Bacillus thermotolerans]